MWLPKQRPRFAVDKQEGYFQAKELERITEAIARGNARWRKLSTVSSICQHVASLQFTSYGQILFETASLFWTKVIFAGLPVCLLKLSHGNKMKQAYVDISVFGWLRKQRPRFTGDKPKCCFHVKELERTTKAIARVNAGWRKLSALSSICQHVATCGNIAVFQMCRERQSRTGSLLSTKVIVPDLLTQGDEYNHECFS